MSKRSGGEASSAEQVHALLLSQGEKLHEQVKAQVLAVGRAAVPELVSILEDESLWDTEGPGDGYAPIHAARLLGELKAVEAAPVMARVLAPLDSMLILYSTLIYALEDLGPEAAPALLAHLDAISGEGERPLLEALSRCGARSDPIFEHLCGYARKDPELGSIFLADYGDPRALPLLHELFEASSVELEEGPFANQVMFELEDAIRTLGGAVTPAEQQVIETVKEMRGAAWGRRATRPAQRPQRPERNAPCWCGSGKKYKKCHLAGDEGTR